MPHQKFAVITLSLCALFSSFRAHAEQTWLEVRSPHFRVLTNGSVGDGRKVANEFEQMRHVFATRFHDDQLESGAPLTIVATTDEDTLRRLEPRFWKETRGNVAGQFNDGWERKFAVVRLDTWGDDNAVVVYHEYTHSVLHKIFHWLPVWLDEGMAEFYGYTWFRSDRILIGAPSQRSEILKERTLLPSAQMLEVTDSMKEYHDDDMVQLFYAEAWGMVHYMTFGPGMENGAKLNAFFKKLDEDEPQQQAFREVFGDPKAFDKLFQQYVRRMAFAAVGIEPDRGLDPKSFAERKLTSAEVEYELGCFRIYAGEAAAGRTAMEKALTLDPKLVGAHEELAFLDFRDGKDEEAMKGWDEALSLDPDRWRSLFARTMVAAGPQLLNQSADRQRAVLVSLRRVNSLAPQFAPAYVEEALLEWRIGVLQRAYADAHHAEMLEPWRAGYHILTGRILLQGNQPAVAASYARFVTGHWKGPDHNEAVELWREVPAQQGTEPAPSWDVPPNTTITQGMLQDVTCDKAPSARPVFLFLPDSPKGAKALELKSDDRLIIGFSDTFWWGEDHFATCYHLAGHRAMIAYEPQKNVVVDVEVRDDLPSVAKAVSADVGTVASGNRP